jgi:hypothetical protein
MTTKSQLRRFWKESYTQKLKINIAMKWQDILNLMRIDKYSESSIESATHTQILKQQKQLNGKNLQIPLNINTNY